MANKPQRFFCLWATDEYPFIDGARLLQMHEEGQVECEGHAGYLKVPLKILLLAEGRRVHTQLKELKCQRQQELDKLQQKYEELAVEVAPWVSTVSLKSSL